MMGSPFGGAADNPGGMESIIATEHNVISEIKQKALKFFPLIALPPLKKIQAQKIPVPMERPFNYCC
jgi:hypothetical protein